MKGFYFICLISIMLNSCNKFDSNSTPEYQNIIGKWHNITGDENVKLIFHKNGKIEEKHDILRSTKLKAKGCSYDHENRIFYFESDVYGVNYHVYTTQAFDTLRIFQVSFNQPDSSLSIAIDFIKD
ncbi:MAG: hypothetical protein K0R65_1149 [Crocinitomicaceae bacterium]|jgi:hypothetical protein|nr:hypothetical protein [Crocinitomicaceae bacterium]